MNEAIIETQQYTGTILVIDDDHDITEIIQLACSDSGYKVLVSHDAGDGIAKFQKYTDEIDAVLLDLALKGDNGIDVLEQIQKISEQTRVIIMSGYISSHNEAIALGAHAILPKPFNLQQLERALESVMQQDKDKLQAQTS